MATRRNQSRSRRRPGQRRNPAQDLWRSVPTPEPPAPITPASDPTVLLDSLGPPPLRGHSSTADHYLKAVVERAAAVATALAASAGMLEATDDE
jgi:hypothetical protein